MILSNYVQRPLYKASAAFCGLALFVVLLFVILNILLIVDFVPHIELLKMSHWLYAMLWLVETSYCLVYMLAVCPLDIFTQWPLRLIEYCGSRKIECCELLPWLMSVLS